MSEPPEEKPPKRVVMRKRWKDVPSQPLQAFAQRLSRETAKGGDFACLITTAEELAELNQRYRGKAESTDVLSFPALPGSEYLGDLAISLPHARAQAAEYGHTVVEEIQVLMLHGVLHLLGMDHETDRGAMRRAETRWRKHFGLPAGLIARVSR